MRTDLFDYDLPQELIAQQPLPQRDGARMLVLDRKTGRVEHSRVKDLSQWLLPNDLMVVNRTKVIPARLFAQKSETGAKVEIFLLRPIAGTGPEEWETLISPAKRIKGIPILDLRPKGKAVVMENLGEGHFITRFLVPGSFRSFLNKHGHVPLPPYIKRGDDAKDRVRYQTLFAQKEGSVAAPTAGLHFTQPLLNGLKKKGVRQASVILHVGLGTFLPVATDEIEDHVMHPERLEVPQATVAQVQKTRAKNGRVIAIGTTVARALESASQDGKLKAIIDETRLFISPGYTFREVDILFTNFHQPRSTLLMMICAFAGRERVLAAYQEAIREGYRFFSYGDAMLIL
jgi:S-adenosylmethionine:tRNA ribosyltransferase-isomerase